MRDPDVGTFRPRPPQTRATEARDAMHTAAQGGVMGAHLWLHDDMVNALLNGQAKAGWHGGVDDQGRSYVALTTLGTRTRWVLTGVKAECPQIPGTWLHEAVWPD